MELVLQVFNFKWCQRINIGRGLSGHCGGCGGRIPGVYGASLYLCAQLCSRTARLCKGDE
jgi:hypothetical protein